MRLIIVIEMILIGAVGVIAGCQSVQRPGTSQNGILGLRKSASRTDDLDEFVDPLGQRSVNRLLLEDLSPAQISTTIKSRFSKINPNEAQRLHSEAQDIYGKAIAQMQAEPEGTKHVKLFEEAAGKFQLAGSRQPESSIEEDSLFFEGESYFFANRYVQANRAYEKLISLYSGSRFLDKAERNRFAIAEYWLQMAEKNGGIALNDPRRPKTNLAGEARRIFHRIRIDDPTGKLADDATMALGMAHFKDESYFDAADTFEDLRRNYPGSRHQFLAHLYELKSRLKSYRGGSYDDTPLVKADKLLTTIVQQFPQQAAEEKEFLALEANRIRNMLADRDLTMAQYFEGRGENRAAKMYYEQVAQNYGDTQTASQVEEQIAALEKLPPIPEQRGEWFVKLFPDPDAEKPVLTAAIKEKLIR